MSIEDHTERTSNAEQEELSLIRQGAQTLAELSGRIAPRFGRAEVRSRVGRYLRGLLATVERKNGWQLAEELGDPNVHGVQRLRCSPENPPGELPFKKTHPCLLSFPKRSRDCALQGDAFGHQQNPNPMQKDIVGQEAYKPQILRALAHAEEAIALRCV